MSFWLRALAAFAEGQFDFQHPCLAAHKLLCLQLEKILMSSCSPQVPHTCAHTHNETFKKTLQESAADSESLPALLSPVRLFC